MKKNEKKIIFALLIVLLIVVILKVTTSSKKEPAIAKQSETDNTVEEEFVQILDDGTKLNKSTELSKAKTLGSLQFTNIQLTNQGGQSVLLADVTNAGSKTSKMQLVDVIVLDKTGKELGRFSGIISPLEPQEKTQFNSSSMRDYANAYDFKVVEKAGN